MNQQGRVLIVIPARLASTRLPRKLLLDRTGKPLIQHTYEAAVRSRLAAEIWVATEDQEIAAAVRRFGGRVQLTGRFETGTDRVAAAVAAIESESVSDPAQPPISVVVNLQGDEPEIDPGEIDRAIEALQQTPAAVMSTLAVPIRDRGQYQNPACVKVVLDRQGRALWFSRSPIPYVRDPGLDPFSQDPPLLLAHVGLYAYRRDFLSRFARLPQSAAEIAESLEQLRVLEHGLAIQVVMTAQAAKGIDTPEDYEAFVSRQLN